MFSPMIEKGSPFESPKGTGNDSTPFGFKGLETYFLLFYGKSHNP
jgi:hypothetical protein